jgi:ActR/RegA family two-component response regulator
MSQLATLIVEDTPDIQDSYKRAVERQGGYPVIATSYVDAIAAVKRRLFPVAIIDVRLSKDDETNLDGLRVLEFIRKAGDGTRAILITGYGSFQIAREAFKHHEVFEGLEKGVSLSIIETTIGKAHQSFQEESRETNLNYSAMLKGSADPQWEWEDRALRMCSPKGGADGLYRFFEALLRDFAPLLQDIHKVGCSINVSEKTGAGLFWSRGQAEAVLIAFGQKAQIVKIQSESDPLELKEIFHKRLSRLGPLLKKVESHGVYGIVRKLEDQDFSSFGSSELSK